MCRKQPRIAQSQDSNGSLRRKTPNTAQTFDGSNTGQKRGQPLRLTSLEFTCLLKIKPV